MESSKESAHAWKEKSGYIPSIITVVIAIISAVVYTLIIPERKLTVYLTMLSTAFIPLIVTYVNSRFRLGIPLYLIIVLCLHVLCAPIIGTPFSLYTTFDWWDLFVHGLFGFIGCDMLYYLYLRFVGERISPIVLFFLFLMTMGLAGLWEIWEFVAGGITGEDPQNVLGSIAAGRSPVFDTMTDMIITMVGIAVFYIKIAICHFKKSKSE